MKGSALKIIATVLAFFFLVAVIPYFLNNLSQQQKTKSLQVRLLQTEGRIRTIPLEEYLIGVVAAEMPAEFEMAALKAQSVAARTYVLKKM